MREADRRESISRNLRRLTMTMSTRNWKRIGSGLVAGAAVALMIGASTPAALAATPTWTVKPGGNISAKSGTTVLTDTKTHTVLKCTSSTTKTTLKKGAKLKGAGIGSVTALSFTKCTGPFSIKFTVTSTASTKKPWKLNAVSYNKKTGVTSGTITGIHATLKGTGCSAVVDGTGAAKNNGEVHVTYTNKTHKLAVLGSGGNLHIYDVKGCLSLIGNGQASSFTATYTVSPGQTITET
jgi:hypothetical protein